MELSDTHQPIKRQSQLSLSSLTSTTSMHVCDSIYMANCTFVICNATIWWYNRISFASFVYVVLPLSFIGIIFNVVSVFVLGRDDTKRQTTRFLFQMLAVADCAFLVSNTTCNADQIYLFTDWLPTNAEVRQFYYSYIVKYLYPLHNITLNAAVWMVVIVTAERYLAVCWPLLARRHITMLIARLRC